MPFVNHWLAESGCGKVDLSIMPKGPNGQKRPADAVALAVMVGRIATGEIEDEMPSRNGRAAGGVERAKVLSEARRKEIAKAAAEARWS